MELKQKTHLAKCTLTYKQRICARPSHDVHPRLCKPQTLLTPVHSDPHVPRPATDLRDKLTLSVYRFLSSKDKNTHCCSSFQDNKILVSSCQDHLQLIQAPKPSKYLCCCSVVKSHPTLCDPMDHSTPSSSVLHYLLEFVQIHVH